MTDQTETSKAEIPKPPRPMTVENLISYLESMSEFYAPVKDQPVMLGGSLLVQATITNGRVVLMTHKDMLNENPPCRKHTPVQHRDGKPPWCHKCRLTADYEDPHGQTS